MTTTPTAPTFGAAELARSPHPVPHIFEHLLDRLPETVETAHAAQAAALDDWRAALIELTNAARDLDAARAADRAALEASVAAGKPTPKPTEPAALDRAQRAEIRCKQTRELAGRRGSQLNAALVVASEQLTPIILEAIETANADYVATERRVRAELEQAASALSDAGEAIAWARPWLESHGLRLGHFDTRPDAPTWPSAPEAKAASQVGTARKRIAQMLGG